MRESKIARKWNKLRSRDPTMPEPILEYMPDKKLYRAMKQITRKESRDERRCRRSTSMTEPGKL